MELYLENIVENIILGNMWAGFRGFKLRVQINVATSLEISRSSSKIILQFYTEPLP